MRVTDDGVPALSDSETITILVNEVNVPPVVDAGPDQVVTFNSPVFFNGSFYDPDNNETHEILWDFGDTFTATGTLTPMHTYSSGGVYEATLYVGDGSIVVSDTTLITVTSMADLSIEMLVSDDPVLAGSTVAYTLTVANNGPQNASVVTVRDTLPPGMILNSVSPECFDNGGDVTCTLETLLAEGSTTVYITATVSITSNGIITNLASVYAVELDDDLANNVAVLTMNVVPSLVVYENDFEGGVGEEWCYTNISTTPSGRSFLGEFNNQNVCLRLDDLPSHTLVTISFDLYIIRSWDGNQVLWPLELDTFLLPNSPVGPDEWQLHVAGETLLHTTFSNWDWLGFPQAYPGLILDGIYPGRTGAIENNTLGFTFDSYPMDAVYHLIFHLEHIGDLLVLNFSAMGLQPMADESWGLDNIKITISAGANLVPYKIYLPIVRH